MTNFKALLLKITNENKKSIVKFYKQKLKIQNVCEKSQ